MSKQLSWMSTKATQLYILRIEQTLNFKTTRKKKYNLDSEQKIEGITAKLVSLEAANKFQISENERLPCSHKVGDLSMLLLRQNNKVNIVCN